MSIENLLIRLDRVKSTGNGRWVASCPTRDDKTPSMTIRELDDGRILIHDFGGSSLQEILDSIGLSFSDLFPEPLTTYAKPKYAGKFSRKSLPDAAKYYQSQNITLKGGGAWRNAICPFHPDTKPSLRINVEKGAYRCMVCGARGGDVLAFHMHLHSMPFVAACKALGAWIGG